MTLAALPKSLCRGVFLADRSMVHVDGDLSGDFSEEFEDQKLWVTLDKPCAKNYDRSTNSNSDGNTVITEDEMSDDDLSLGDDVTRRDFMLSSLTDQELIAGIEEAHEQEKLVLVGSYLREMTARRLRHPDSGRHATMVEQARLIEDAMVKHQTLPEDGGWKKHSHLKFKGRDTMVYYKYNEEGNIVMRWEMPVEAKMLVPFFAVLNECDLWKQWFPNLHHPVKLGMADSKTLARVSRGTTCAMAQVNLPWPLKNREVYVKAMAAEAVDEIDGVVISARTIAPGFHHELNNIDVPEVKPGWDRIDLDATIMARPCPQDHPAKVANMKRNGRKYASKRFAKDEEPNTVLLSFIMEVKPSLNMILKAVAGPIWMALMYMVEDVMDGKRPQHAQAIKERNDLYGWIQEKVAKIVEKVC